MTTPRIGTRVRIISTGEEGTLKARGLMRNGRKIVIVDYDKPNAQGFTGIQVFGEDIEAVPKQRKKA